MTNYQTIKTTDQFIDLMKELDFPPSGTIEELTVPKMKFITFSGKGSPQSGDFQGAIQSLYGIAYTIKMGLKFNKLSRPAGYFDYRMPPLEGLWWQADGKWDMNKKSGWQWKVMIMVPDFVGQELFEEAKRQAKLKHPEVPYNSVRLEPIEEGKSIQTTHIGPYSTEPATVEKLTSYAAEHNYQIAGKHHEIYMGDPRRTKPEKLKTVLRYPVK